MLKSQIEDKSKFGKLFPLIKNMSPEKIEEFLKKQKVSVELVSGNEKESFELDEENLLIVTEITKTPEEGHLVSGEEDFVYDLDI